ncbi:hypothetical protein PC112_g21287 [Phytophthora cactorum]|nr:hypothetical protein PC112_g21287 [Phytophthora cactorum]
MCNVSSLLLHARVWSTVPHYQSPSGRRGLNSCPAPLPYTLNSRSTGQRSLGHSDYALGAGPRTQHSANLSSSATLRSHSSNSVRVTPRKPFPAKTLEARSRRSGTERLGEGEATAGHHNSLALVHAQAVKQAPYARHRSDRLRDHVDEVMGSHRHLALAVRCAWRTPFCYRKDFVLAVAHRQRVESRVSMSR